MKRLPFICRRSSSIKRRGTTTVELAFVLPVFFVMVMAIIHICHLQMVEFTLKSACRHGARLGSTGAATTAQVVTKVKSIADAALDTSKITVLVKNASAYEASSSRPKNQTQYNSMPNAEVSTIDPRTLYLVRASVPYKDVALFPLPMFNNLTISAEVWMRRE